MELILITPGYSLLNHFPPSLLHLFACFLSFSFRYALSFFVFAISLFLKTKKFTVNVCFSLLSLSHFTTLHMDPEDRDAFTNAYVPGAKRGGFASLPWQLPMGNPHGYSR